jgi:hypothetical protein
MTLERYIYIKKAVNDLGIFQTHKIVIVVVVAIYYIYIYSNMHI